jgi:hypothetical protein
MQSKYLSEIFDKFLSVSEYPEADAKILSILLEYLECIYSEEAEREKGEIFFKDLTHYEVDDFLNFYLDDNFDDADFLKKQGYSLFKRFLNFASKEKLISKEVKKDWTEVLS